MAVASVGERTHENGITPGAKAVTGSRRSAENQQLERNRKG